MCSVVYVSLCVDGAFRGLRELLVGGVGHVSPQFNQDGLHCVVSGPVGQAGKFGGVDGSVSWIDTGQVNFGNELDERWLVRILITAVHLEAVDSVFMDTMWGT